MARPKSTTPTKTQIRAQLREVRRGLRILEQEIQDNDYDAAVQTYGEVSSVLLQLGGYLSFWRSAK